MAHHSQRTIPEIECLSSDPLLDRVRGKPDRPPALRSLGEPGILNHFCQFVPGELADPARSQQYRRVAIEVWSREERGRRVLDHRLLVRLGRKPDNDHVRVACSGLRVSGVRARIAEEDKRLTTDLVDGVTARSKFNRHMGHCHGQLVHVLDPLPSRIHRHVSSVGSVTYHAAPNEDLFVKQTRLCSVYRWLCR